MTESLSLLKEWVDGDFWKTGAYITISDTKEITLGKGGHFRVSNKIEICESPVFYLKDFFENSYLVYTPDSSLTLPFSAVLDYVEQLSDGDHDYPSLQNDDDIYEKDFKLLMNKFKEGIEKTVLISRETYAKFKGEETIRRLFKKSFQFGVGVPYGLWNSQYGMIGSSPEVLFSFQDNILKTFALAGTARKGQEEELLHSEKDLHEHKLVVLDICEKLSPFISELKTHETKISPYKSLIHLKTEIEAVPQEEIDLTSLTNALSPTAALGGYPKLQSLNFLKNSHYSRKYTKRYFGSAFGLTGQSSKEFIVSIRNVQWENNEIFIESGGGIVPESQFEKELEEIQMKRATIKKHYL